MPSITQVSLTLAFLLQFASQAVADHYGSDDELAARDEIDDSAYMLERYDDSLFERDEPSEYLNTRGLGSLLKKPASKLGSLASKAKNSGNPLKKPAGKVGSLASKAKNSGKLVKNPATKLGSLASKAKRPGNLLKKPAGKLGGLSSHAKRPGNLVKKPAKKLGSLASKTKRPRNLPIDYA